MEKNTYPWNHILALTPQHYVDALLDLEDEQRISDIQRSLLCEHARHRTMTTNQLAHAVGRKGHPAVNAEYGRLAHLLWRKLPLPLPEIQKPYGTWIGVIGGGPVVRGHEWRNKMHSSLATAVKELMRRGWCGKGQTRIFTRVVSEDTSHPRGGGWRLGDAINRARVERAAVDAVTRNYHLHGWTVESKEKQIGIGYDLRCSRRAEVHHVEVKGISGSVCGFEITANEKHKAQVDPAFWLIAVTHALSAKRKLWKYAGRQLLRQFSFAPISFTARLR